MDRSGGWAGAGLGAGTWLKAGLCWRLDRGWDGSELGLDWGSAWLGLGYRPAVTGMECGLGCFWARLEAGL